jgi:hypothetical protein
LAELFEVKLWIQSEPQVAETSAASAPQVEIEI